MNTLGFLVVVRLPERVELEQAIHDIRTSIGFGHPAVYLHFIIPDPPEEVE